MGWTDRLHDVLTATGGALEAPVGFAKDTVVALPDLAQGDFTGFTGDVYHAMVGRLGQEVGALIGPEGIGGTVIGGLPEQSRAGFHDLIDPTQNAMDLAYHDLVGKPISAALTAGSLSDRPGGGGVVGLLEGRTLAEAWDIAEHRSPGQSLALLFLTKDILDPAETRKAQGTDWYTWGSGVADAAVRLFADPTAVALSNTMAFRAGLRSLTTDAAIVGHSAEISKLADAMGGMDSATIRQRFFAKHSLGAPISDMLANAENLPGGLADGLTGAAARERVLRIVAGATDELVALRATRPDLADEIERLAYRRGNLIAVSLNGEALAHTPDDLANIDKAIDAVHSQELRLDRLEALSGSLREMPHASLKGRFTTGDVYQRGPFSKVLHTAFSMEPHPWIHLDDPGADASVWRMLQKSELPLEEQTLWRSRYIEASGPLGRLNVLHQAEDAAVGSIGAKRGLDLDEMKAVLAEAGRGRGMAKKALDSRKYDGTGLSMIQLEDQYGMSHQLMTLDTPLYETQLPNLAPIVDMDRVKAAVSPIAKFKARFPGYPAAKEALDVFASVWKPAVLLRIGFPARFLTDESLRSMAKIGVLSTAKNVLTGAVAGGSELRARALATMGIDTTMSHAQIAAKVADWTGEDAVMLGQRAREAAAGEVSKAKFVDQLGEEFGYGNGAPGLLLSPARHLTGMDPVRIAGHSAEGAFGPPGDMANIYQKLIRAREAFGTLISKDEGKVLDQLIQSGQWRSVHPVEDAVSYPAAWEHAVNNQIGKSKLGARLLERMQSPTKTALAEGAVPRTREEIVTDTANWLRNSPEGRKVADSLPVRKNFEDWVGAAHDQIANYLPTDELKAAAWNGTADAKMLERTVQDAALRPIVHGGIVDEAMGGPIGRAWRGVVDVALKNLVGRPSNVLIRNPFFDHMYQAEMSRQIGLFTGEPQMSLPERIGRRLGGAGEKASTGIEVTPEDLDRMQINARRYAMGETKNLFHNFAEEPHMAKVLGQLSPFFTAYTQIMARWAGLAVENPAFIRRLQIVWRSPERAGLVTDGRGNVVDEHDKITTPAAGSDFKAGAPAADGERNVVLHLPEWAHNLPGLKRVGDFRYGKDSLNLLAHGAPPVGPIVQVATNEIAKQRPDLESSLKWALPFGATQDVKGLLLPTLARRLNALSEGEENRQFAHRALRMFSDRVVDYNLGRSAKRPTWQDALHDAKSIEHVRTLASFVLPVSPQYTSPYQPYIDALRARRELDAHLTVAQKTAPEYQTPDEWFLDTFGPEFFPLVASMSKSIDGIAPTVKGQRLHEQYADLISKYPELGSLITGQQGAGTFSQSIYEAQFNQNVGPSSQLKERVDVPFDTFKNEASIKLGWLQFGRVMDQLDSVRVQRGLTSFNVKGAQDLAAMKKAAVEYLATAPQYAGWYEDYAASDPTKWDQKIAGMTTIVNDPKIVGSDRPEMRGLAQYLNARQQITAALAQIGRSHLHAQESAQLAAGWDAYVGQLVDENPAFGALYNRWLQNDPVNVTPITALAQSGGLA